MELESEFVNGHACRGQNAKLDSEFINRDRVDDKMQSRIVSLSTETQSVTKQRAG